MRFVTAFVSPPFLTADLAARFARILPPIQDELMDLSELDFEHIVSDLAPHIRVFLVRTSADVTHRIFSAFHPKWQVDLSETNLQHSATRDFLEDCLVALKRQLYSREESKELFDPRSEGRHRRSFVAGEGYLRNVLYLSEQAMGHPYLCRNCRTFGDRGMLVAQLGRRRTCMGCQPVAPLRISLRYKELQQEKTTGQEEADSELGPEPPDEAENTPDDQGSRWLREAIRLTGINRQAYSPYVGALFLWLMSQSSSSSWSDAALISASARHPWEKTTSSYVERFLARENLLPERLADPPSGNDNLLETATTKTKEILQALALKALDVDPGETSDAYRSHPGYTNALEKLIKLTPLISGLRNVQLTSCPQCHLVGDIEAWFGFRVVRGNPIPQSWCWLCRTRPHPESPRKIRESRQVVQAPEEGGLPLSDAESWFALAHWGAKTGKLNGWERRFAYSMGIAYARKRPLTDKQQNSARRIAEKALAHGFSP